MFKFILVIFLFLVELDTNVFAKNEPRSCPSGEHWVRAHSQSGYSRSDGTPVSGSFHRAHCQANPPAYAVWHDRLKNDSALKWEIKGEKSKPWSENEKEKTIEALSSIPSVLLQETVTGIFRMTSSKQLEENPASGFDHNIAIYDRAFKNESNLTRILSHEFSHEMFRQMPAADRIDYAQAADWATEEDTPGRLTLIPVRTGFVEDDGKNSVNEDFSNNIEYFLFNPATLKVKSPKVFDWINKKFGDKLKLGGRKI